MKFDELLELISIVSLSDIYIINGLLNKRPNNENFRRKL
jgi:hypothetical protein